VKIVVVDNIRPKMAGRSVLVVMQGCTTMLLGVTDALSAQRGFLNQKNAKSAALNAKVANTPVQQGTVNAMPVMPENLHLQPD
jgi:hypothetical protein